MREAYAPGSVRSKLSKTEEERRVSLYHAGHSDAVIGKRVGRSKGAIFDWRMARGLPSLLAPRPGRTAQAFHLFTAGCSIITIARTLNVHPATVRIALSKEGRVPSRWPEGWLQSRERAVTAYVNGAMLSHAARDHAVSQSALRAELRRRGLARPPLPNASGSIFTPLRQLDVEAMLGRVPDRLIARVLGCAHNTVWARRRALGVPPCPRLKAPPIEIYSIDATRPRGGSYHELYKDEAWSDWLEGAGATVW